MAAKKKIRKATRPARKVKARVPRVLKAKPTVSKGIGLKPAAGYLLIEPQATETKTTSGIYLPDSATGEKPQKGKVLAVGADEVTDSGTKRSAPAKVGDWVVYKKWGGNEFKIGNIEYLFVKFEDILAVES